MLQKRLRSIVTAIVLDYAPHALVAVKESVRDVREVVKTVARQLVAVGVGKVAKDVVMQCAKAIALQDVKLHVTVSVVNRA